LSSVLNCLAFGGHYIHSTLLRTVSTTFFLPPPPSVRDVITGVTEASGKGAAANTSAAGAGVVAAVVLMLVVLLAEVDDDDEVDEDDDGTVDGAGTDDDDDNELLDFDVIGVTVQGKPCFIFKMREGVHSSFQSLVTVILNRCKIMVAKILASNNAMLLPRQIRGPALNVKN